MKCMRTGVVAASLVVASLANWGCNSYPQTIHPAPLPGGGQTPRIDFYPPPGAVPNLPPGFHACDSFTTQVTLQDGSTITLSGCVYCADNPNDPTVYVQHNCTGGYWKGIKRTVATENGGGVTQMPEPVQVSGVGGQLGLTNSLITFVVDEDADIVPVMIEFEGTILFDGMTYEELEENGIDTLYEGMEISIQGTNEQVADLLFWGFGATELKATSDSGDEIVLKVGYSSLLGAVVIPYVNGVPDLTTGRVGFLPWRDE